MCGGGGGERWVKEETLGSCVYVGGGGVKEVILFRGFQNILEQWGYLHGAKRHAARGDLSYAFTRGVWRHASPRIFFKMGQPYLKIS